MKWQNKLKVVAINLSASVEEAIKLLKPYGDVMASMRCFQKTTGVIIAKLVYTTTTQSGTLYRSDMIDNKSLRRILRRLSKGNVLLIFIMHIEHEVKLNYDDVLIRPKRSTLGSRKEVDLERGYSFRNLKRQ